MIVSAKCNIDRNPFVKRAAYKLVLIPNIWFKFSSALTLCFMGVKLLTETSELHAALLVLWVLLRWSWGDVSGATHRPCWFERLLHGLSCVVPNKGRVIRSLGFLCPLGENLKLYSVLMTIIAFHNKAMQVYALSIKEANSILVEHIIGCWRSGLVCRIPWQSVILQGSRKRNTIGKLIIFYRFNMCTYDKPERHLTRHHMIDGWLYILYSTSIVYNKRTTYVLSLILPMVLCLSEMLRLFFMRLQMWLTRMGHRWDVLCIPWCVIDLRRCTCCMTHTMQPSPPSLLTVPYTHCRDTCVHRNCAAMRIEGLRKEVYFK